MLTILGAIAFGIVATGAWIHAETQEQKDRRSSRKNGRDFYFDKNGRMRHVGSGRKYTVEEVNKFCNPISLEDRLGEYKRKSDELYEKTFYGVMTNDMVYHFFLTEKEAKEFVEEYNKTDIFQIKYDGFMYDKLFLESMKNMPGTKYYFDYNKYVGVLDKPWERK